jgi:hypothetical protein
MKRKPDETNLKLAKRLYYCQMDICSANAGGYHYNSFDSIDPKTQEQWIEKAKEYKVVESVVKPGEFEEVRMAVQYAVDGIKDTGLNQWTFSKEIVTKLHRILEEQEKHNADHKV